MNSTVINAAIVAVLLMAAAAMSAVVPKPGEFDRLIAAKGEAVREVIDSPTLYRVAMLDGLPCGSDTFEFLLDRPRTSMLLARWVDPEMDDYRITQLADGSYHVEDGGKLTGDMEMVYDTGNGRVYYITGQWKFVLGMTFKGRMVLVPEYTEHQGKDGPVTDATARGYMKIDNVVVGYMAKVVTFIFPGLVDGRIKRFAGAVKKVAAKVNEEPEDVYRKLAEPGGVPAGELEDFRKRFVPDVTHGG